MTVADRLAAQLAEAEAEADGAAPAAEQLAGEAASGQAQPPLAPKPCQSSGARAASACGGKVLAFLGLSHAR